MVCAPSKITANIHLINNESNGEIIFESLSNIPTNYVTLVGVYSISDTIYVQSQTYSDTISFSGIVPLKDYIYDLSMQVIINGNVNTVTITYDNGVKYFDFSLFQNNNSYASFIIPPKTTAKVRFYTGKTYEIDTSNPQILVTF